MLRYFRNEGTALYTEQDFSDIRAQLNKRLLFTAIPTVILLAAIIVSFVFRVKLLTMALTLILGAGLIFVYSMLIYPVYAYKRHLNNVLHGKTRTLTGAFKEMEEEKVDEYIELMCADDPGEI